MIYIRNAVLKNSSNLFSERCDLFCKPCTVCNFLELKKISWRRAWQFTPVFLPAESPWTEEPGRLQSLGSQKRHE